MGAGQSNGGEIGGSSMGYQVLRVYTNSPGSRAGLKAYFDFILAIGNTRFNKENGSLREILKASVDQKLKMIVFNTRTKRTREVEIIPSTSWGGNGLLGVSIKHSSFDRADERVWHVIEVEPGSPAIQAGFKPNEDYVIGSDSILQESDDLYNLIEAHEGKALKLFVYNAVTDNCREVVCHPNSRWGGKGYLGCEFGHGLLHRIPYSGDDSPIEDNQSAPLLRNEQPIATQQEPNIVHSAAKQNAPQPSYQVWQEQQRPPLQGLLAQNQVNQPGFQNWQEQPQQMQQQQPNLQQQPLHQPPQQPLPQTVQQPQLSSPQPPTQQLLQPPPQQSQQQQQSPSQPQQAIYQPELHQVQQPNYQPGHYQIQPNFQPGHQLFQQALLTGSLNQPQQQQYQYQNAAPPVHQQSIGLNASAQVPSNPDVAPQPQQAGPPPPPPPPQVAQTPQTFAQLANAQFQQYEASSYAQ